MNEKTIMVTCPYCKQQIPLDEALTHQLKEKLRKEYDEGIKKREQEIKAKEAAITKREQELTSQLAQERKKLEEEAKKKAHEEVSYEFKALKGELEEKSKQIKEFREKELQLRKEKQKIEEERQNLELEIARKMDEERTKIKEEATKQAYEQYRLKDVEKDRHIEALKNQIEDLKRKVEQGPGESGEALEWVLETTLKEHFRHDKIEPVPRGIRGADVIQRVYNNSGQICGTIIWESKRVKNWNDGWIEKLKEDQRDAKADIAALVSTVLPKDFSGIGNINGVWVADYTLAIGLASALRYALIEVSTAKVSLEGRSEKLEMLYDYLSGIEFRQQIEGIVEAFVTMKADLDTERRAMEKIWAKREKQIEKVVKNTSRMYGSLQGIVGSTLPELKSLELKALKGE